MSESVADEEEDDIYKNLPDVKYDDTLKKLEKAYKELESRIQHLEKQYHETVEENLKLKEENHNLHENISSLLKTANNELKRKDRVIEELRQENNQLIFRRKKSSQKTEIKRHKCADVTNVQQEEELVHSCSNVQRHGGGLRLMSATSDMIMDVKEINSVLKADNILPITQTCTTKSWEQYSNQVNDVTRLETNPSASAEIFSVGSVQDNYSTSKVQNNVVETVFTARMRKRLNAYTENNNKEIFVSTSTKQLCRDEKINSSKGKKQPHDETTRHNNQEPKAIETVKEAVANEEKSVNSGTILIELDSYSSGSVELDSMDENRDHRCTTKAQSNMVETVFNEQMRYQLNTSAEMDGKEIPVCTDTKQSRDSKLDDTKVNSSKDEKDTNDETARHNNEELKVTENVKETTRNTGNILGELESDYSRPAELCSMGENQDHHCTTRVQNDMVETVISEQVRKVLNSSAEKDSKILVCMGTKQSRDSRIDEAKINSSKEERKTNDETTRRNLELKATEIVKEAIQNEEPSANAGNIIGELESNSSGSVEFHTVDAKQDCHSATDIKKNMVENVFNEKMRNQLDASIEENDRGIVVYKDTKQSYVSKIDEVEKNSSKEERYTNDETATHNTQELKATEIWEESTQHDEKSVNAGNIIGELESNSSESVEVHTVDAKQDCHSAMYVQKNVGETILSEQMRKQLNTSTGKGEKEILVCTGTKQMSNSRTDVTKINSSKEETLTNETARHITHQELEATEIQKETPQNERKFINIGKIIGELESDSSGSIEISSVDAKQNCYCTTKGQKNVAETVFITEMKKQLNASLEIEHKEIVCTVAKQSFDLGSCIVKINSSKKERGKNTNAPEHNTHKILEDTETSKGVPLNERTFVNADNVLGELKSNSCRSVESESVGAKQDYQCNTKSQNNGVEREQLNDLKEADDSETLAYTHSKEPDDPRSHDNKIKKGDGDINDATVEHKTVEKFESTINTKEISLNERKFGDAVNTVGKRPLTNLNSDDGSVNSTPEHVGVDSKKHHSDVSGTRPHSPAFKKCHRSSSLSSSIKSSSVESCVIQPEERRNVQKSSQRENAKHVKQDVKANYHTGKQTELIRPVKASPSVRVANSVKSKYSRSRSKTPFDGSRFKIPKLSSKRRVQIERSSVLEQNDSDSDSTRTRYPRQSSFCNSYRAYASYRSRSHVRQSFRNSQHYTEHRKYKHRDSSPVREGSSSRYKHERRHSSAKFHDKDKRHIATRHSNVSKRPDPTIMETNGLLKKNIYCTDAEIVIHSPKKPRNVDFSLKDYRKELLTGKSAVSCFLGDEKHPKPSPKISEHQNVMAENYDERKTKRTKSYSLNEMTEKENLNICKDYEYKLKKITFENKEYRKPVSEFYHRLVSNSSCTLDKVQDTPEQFQSITNEPYPMCNLGSTLLATEEQRKENIVSSSDAQNVTGQTANDTEGKQKKFCNSAVFKTDGVSVSIFRETCDFSTSRKRKSVVIRSQRTSGSHELDSPEEKRQRRSNDDKIIVETTNASVVTVHDDKRGQSVVEKTSLVQSGVTVPVGSSVGESRADSAPSLNVESHIDSKDGCNQQELPLDKVTANEEGLYCSTENFSDHHELKFKNAKLEQSGKTEATNKRKRTRDTRIEDMREELEEGEIIDDSPVKTSTAVARFSELEHNVTLEHSCHRNVSKEVSQRISPTLCSKRLLQFSDTVGQSKSSKSNRHSTSSPTLGDHLLHKEQQQDTYERQKMNFETNKKCKVLDKFQNTDSKDLGINRKASSQHVKANELNNSITMNEKTQNVEPVTISAKFEKESCDSNDKDPTANEKPLICQMNDTVTSSVVSESTCLFGIDSQYTKSDRQWHKQSNGNEMICKGEVQASSDPKSLEDGFSLCSKDVIVSEGVNLSLNIETEETRKQTHDRKPDKLKKIIKTKLAESCSRGLSSGDTVDKNVGDSNRQIQVSDNSLISDIGVNKGTQPEKCQKPSSEHNKRTSKEHSEQVSKDVCVKGAVTPLSCKQVSPPRRKKNARMTISTSQSSLQSEILMANLLQTHSSYKVGIHDESLSASSKYTEEIENGATYNDNGSLICNTSKGSINTQSDDKHNSNSQRITRSKTTRLSSLSCQPDERICNSEKSLKSPKGGCKMTPQYCQSEVQDIDSVCSDIVVQVDNINVNKHLEYEKTCLHSCRDLKSASYQLVTDDKKDEVGLQEISEASINESRETLGKDSMKIIADGCTEIRGGKEPLSGEELLKILEGSFENESGGSENLAKESNSLESENAVMISQPQPEINTTPDFPSATNKKNIIIRRRSRKCVLEEAPMEFITIKPLDDISPDNLIDSSVAASTDEPSTNNNSPVCVTPSVPLCLQHDDSSCSSSSSSTSSRSSRRSSSVSSCSSNCSNSSSSVSDRSSASGSSKSTTSGQQEESDMSNNTNMLRKSLRATPARRLYQKKSQMAVHQPQNECNDSQELDTPLNSSSSDDTFNPKKGLAKQLNGTWVKKKRPRNKR